jgi:prepilin-type processing-associated H-X9-DG protein
MNDPEFSKHLTQDLLEQDEFLSSAEFNEHRKKVAQRLARATKTELAARRQLVAAAGGTVAAIGLAVLGVQYGVQQSVAPPEWFLDTVAMVVILSPVGALALAGIYLYRYRLELVRARSLSAKQSLLELSHRIAELRREIIELKKASKQPRGPDHNSPTAAFTLVEALTVVVILGIIASMLLPSITKTVRRSRSTECQNSLTQLTKSLLLYEYDYRYLPGAGGAALTTNSFPWIVSSPESWLIRIIPYVGTNESLTRCAEDINKPTGFEWRPDSYGYNAGGSCPRHDPSHDVGLGYGKSDFISSSRAASPANMVSIGDLQLPASVADNVISPWHVIPNGPFISVIPDRHATGANMAFLDGHVEWGRREAWIAESAVSRSRWNRDNQPHRETW